MRFVTAATAEVPRERIDAVLTELRERHSSYGHQMEALFLFSDNCTHVHPDDVRAYDGVDDLIDEWVKRNLFGLSYTDGNLYYRNRERAFGVIPLVAQFHQAEDEWGDLHVGGVCLDSPMGEHCLKCDEVNGSGSEDSGFDAAPCIRQEQAREERDEFWSLFETA